MKLPLILVAFVLAGNMVIGQTPHMKFGKPLMEELKMSSYPLDTAANAIIMVDYGESKFTYNKAVSSFQIQFERYTRIKILNPGGYDFADVSVGVYHSGGNKERVSGIKGNTYNLVNGKIEATKLGKNSKFEEKLSEHWNLEKFTLPNVKAGSVIEYSYTVTSDFIFQLRDWQFQTTIPTVWSEYKAGIPEYFDYKQLSQGYVAMDIKEHDILPGSINFQTSTRSGNYSTKSTISNNTVSFENHVYRWATSDVPAFKKERYLTSVDDHISKIEFELSTITYPGSPIQQVMDSWSTLEKKLKESESFGLAMKRSGFFKDKLESITNKSSGDMETMKNVYDFVQNHMDWNGSRSIYVDVNLKKAFDAREGNTADINLLLISMLRSAGLSANPVILSTRDHGKVIEYYPILSKFNYVVAEVILDEKSYLLDATDKYCPINILPFRCLNKQGRRISDNSGWVNLIASNKAVDLAQMVLDLKEDGSLTGTLIEKQKGYIAASRRQKILKDGQEEYVAGRFKDASGWDVEGFNFKQLETKGETLVSTFEVSLTESAEALGGLIYLNPIFSEDLKENPFKTENRLYPVDFGSENTQTYIVTINLPEGYEVDEMPESAVFALPNSAGIFRYNILNNGRNIQLMSTITIKQAEFNSQEYPGLREFYNRIVDKHHQQIVLKKI